ncbi:cytochrome P450 [Rhodobacteraceae bacterium 2CG4]|uniref:Cytochrome P450 n=2 Tax=Halovulum marinum TaxID=2662447 RepID=A0A6L5Z4S6_9RHOB|nr:cytochrome P450 [Halovulum marinum]
MMLRPVTCLCGAEAAREFYRPGRMTRRGAMPATVVALLQDKGSVQALDGAAHRVRKAMFLDLMTARRLDAARRIFAGEWTAAADGWQGRTVALRDAVDDIMTRTALRWCGIAAPDREVAARRAELSAMVGAAGSIGPAHLRARLLRERSERWARGVIRHARQAGAVGATADAGVVARLALHVDADGSRMTEAAAAVELLNILRPILAAGRYVVFAAHALHVHRETIPFAAPDAEAMHRAFAQEVRRLYPFFPVIGGRVLQPFDWRGAHFDAGDWLLLDLYGTNRDPATWPAPETFRPERHLGADAAPEALVPQGGGDPVDGHRCPGEDLTVALTTEAIARLRTMTWQVPEQDLSLPRNRFPPWPRDGMRISVAAAGGA